MPTVTVVNWNIQNYGPTKSGQRFGNRDVVRAIAKVVNDVNADIFVLLEVNTTHVATAQQVSDIMRAELREAALNPDTATGYLYFLAIPNGGGKTVYAKTKADHDKQVAKYFPKT